MLDNTFPDEYPKFVDGMTSDENNDSFLRMPVLLKSCLIIEHITLTYTITLTQVELECQNQHSIATI